MHPALQTSLQIFQTSDFYLTRSLTGVLPELYTRRVERTNSILWTTGHVTVGRCRLLTMIGHQQEIPWVDVFGKGSSEQEGMVYPEMEAVLAVFHAASAQLAPSLAVLTEDDLSVEASYDLPASGRTLLGTINYMAYHEAYHIGQISAIRKALGIGAKYRTIERILTTESPAS